MLTSIQKRNFKEIGHHLNPVLIVNTPIISENVKNALEQVLNDHELVKIKVPLATKEERLSVIDALLSISKAQLVQSIGKMSLLYRSNPHAREKLSNIKRHALV